jgi:hypothetical protein
VASPLLSPGACQLAPSLSRSLRRRWRAAPRCVVALRKPPSPSPISPETVASECSQSPRRAYRLRLIASSRVASIPIATASSTEARADDRSRLERLRRCRDDRTRRKGASSPPAHLATRSRTRLDAGRGNTTFEDGAGFSAHARLGTSNQANGGCGPPANSSREPRQWGRRRGWVSGLRTPRTGAGST